MDTCNTHRINLVIEHIYTWQKRQKLFFLFRAISLLVDPRWLPRGLLATFGGGASRESSCALGGPSLLSMDTYVLKIFKPASLLPPLICASMPRKVSTTCRNTPCRSKNFVETNCETWHIITNERVCNAILLAIRYLCDVVE